MSKFLTRLGLEIVGSIILAILTMLTVLACLSSGLLGILMLIPLLIFLVVLPDLIAKIRGGWLGSSACADDGWSQLFDWFGRMHEALNIQSGESQSAVCNDTSQSDKNTIDLSCQSSTDALQTDLNEKKL